MADDAEEPNVETENPQNEDGEEIVEGDNAEAGASTHGGEGDDEPGESVYIDDGNLPEITPTDTPREPADDANVEEVQHESEGENQNKEDEENEEKDNEKENVEEEEQSPSDSEEKLEEQTEKADDQMDGIPQSDTFADGEKHQSPIPQVTERLSREGSLHEQQTEERAFSPPIAGSPHHEQIEEPHTGINDLEEEMLTPEQDREALIEMYHQAIAEREQLQTQNHQLQHKLAEYFKKKRSDEQKAEAVDKNEADQEQRYLKYMSQLEELRAEDQQIREQYEREIDDLRRRCDEKSQEVQQHRQKFMEFKQQVALNSINSRTGKPIPPKDIQQYLGAESRKDEEVIGVRLENIKLKNKLKKKEMQLKSKEELADGLHLIDFEQLKIENQTYNEKIEERNEELLKLRKKITNTVQVLTHLKEKLQFVQAENTLLKNQLREVESSVAQKRDILTRTKQARDALRIDNHRLRQNCGLLGNERLLRDFEERKDEADDLRERLERLKMQHAELTLNTSSVRRKIEQMKAVEQ